VVTIDAKLAYRNKGDADDDWKYYASSREERILECDMKQVIILLKTFATSVIPGNRKLFVGWINNFYFDSSYKKDIFAKRGMME
jgi:hypothetical protein